MTIPKPPPGLGSRGRRLWRAILSEHTLPPAELVILEEACRLTDRLEKLDLLLRGEVDTWCSLVADINSDGRVFELRMTQALSQANATATLLKQLLAALRLPDAVSGKRPQHRGAPRGAYQAAGATKVSSLEKARAAKTGA